MNILRTGDLAYFDTFAGLIPCKVTRITGTSGYAGSSQVVHFTLTARRGAYKRGEHLSAWGLHVVPRRAVHHGNRIRAYQVEVSV